MGSFWTFSSLDKPILIISVLGILFMVLFATAQINHQVAILMNRYYVPLAILSFIGIYLCLVYLFGGLVITFLFNNFPQLSTSLYRDTIILIIVLAASAAILWFVQKMTSKVDASLISSMTLNNVSVSPDISTLVKELRILIKEIRKDRKNTITKEGK